MAIFTLTLSLMSPPFRHDARLYDDIALDIFFFSAAIIFRYAILFLSFLRVTLRAFEAYFLHDLMPGAALRAAILLYYTPIHMLLILSALCYYCLALVLPSHAAVFI